MYKLLSKVLLVTSPILTSQLLLFPAIAENVWSQSGTTIAQATSATQAPKSSTQSTPVATSLPANAVAQLPEAATPPEATPSGKPLIKIVALGGTIANSPQGRLSVESLLENIPGVQDIADIEIVDYIRIGSSAITLQNEIEVADIINDILANEPNVAGIVVTQGSNTSEETAYFLNLVVKSDKPVVVVAAQRQQNTLGEDGRRNLFDAVRVAASPEAAGKGVLLAVNEQIHAARDVTKTITYRVETWNSGDLGVLGLIDTDRISFYRSPTRKHTATSEFSLEGITDASQLPRVDIVYSYLDADKALVSAAANQEGQRGLVVAAFPTGSATPAQQEVLLEAAQKGVIVAISNRGGLGRVRTGGEFVGADNLTPQKARLLLILALTKTSDPNEIQRVFNEY